MKIIIGDEDTDPDVARSSTVHYWSDSAKEKLHESV